MDSKLMKICLAACVALSAAACEETKNGGLDCDAASWVPECLSDTSYVACNNGRLESVDCAALNQGKCVADASVGAKCEGASVNNCGNGSIDAGEECDGSNLNNKSCADYKGVGATGSLSCSSDCKIVSSACQSAVVSCNSDGVKDADEECDGSDFGDKTCENYQGANATGSLSCNNCAIDSSACVAAQVNNCGNGNIDADEECDGSNLNNHTCSDVLGRSANGDLSCDSDCKLVDSACTPLVIDTCNNDGTKDGAEECDGADFGGKSCSDFAGEGATGVLSCDGCVIDYSDCEEADPCGNGRLDDGEDCDGSNLNGKSCADVLGVGVTGDLSCSAVCMFDTSNCRPVIIDTCNNDGTKNGEEECDGDDFGGKTCVDYQGAGATGDLSCKGCVIDPSACKAAVSDDCGNGNIDAGEECDGSNLNGKSCADYKGAGATGSLSCADNCTIISADCKAAVVDNCGNGAIDAGEECDGSDFGDKTCVDYKGANATGTLSCNGCVINSSACKAAGVDPCGDGVYDEGEDCSCENLTEDVCTADGNVAYCATGSKIHLIDCDSGCALLDASEVAGGEYWSAECKHPGFDEDCTEAGDLLDAYCTVEEYEGEEYAFAVQYLCAEDKNGNLGTIDLINWGEYEDCDSGCDDTNTACAVSETCGDGNYDSGEDCSCENLTDDVCTADGNGAFCSQGKIGIVECSSGCALVDFSEMLGREYWSAECKRPEVDAQCTAAGDQIPFCDSQGTTYYSSNYYCGATKDGGLGTVDTSMWGQYSLCSSTCNAAGTACEGDGKSCSDNATIKVCSGGECKEYKCGDEYGLEGSSCVDLGGSYGANCYLPCTTESNLCINDSYYGIVSVGGTCVNGAFVSRTSQYCAGECAADGTCAAVSDLDGTDCNPSTDKSTCDSSNVNVILSCNSSTKKWTASNCDVNDSGVALECAVAGSEPECLAPCSNPGESSSVCQDLWGIWSWTTVSTCTATASGNYFIDEEVDCDNGCNEAGDACAEVIIYACDDYPAEGGCVLEDGRNCSDVCEAGELCAVVGSSIICGDTCTTVGANGGYHCEYYEGTEWEGYVDAYPRTCEELSDGSKMWVTGDYIECGMADDGATCSETTGCGD